MLSLLIPTYNYDCSALVYDLAQQCAALQQVEPEFDYEIIVGDDGSTDLQTKEANRRIESTKGCTYWESPHNLGRSLIRNALLARARFPYVLLMDADAAVCLPDFIAGYWAARHEADVIVGGLRNPDVPCPRGCELRYRYERAAERERQATQQEEAHLHFSVFNALIYLPALGDLRFDERCQEYGYEDALLGLKMKERGLRVIARPLPLIHMGIDTNTSFLAKTEAAMRTLTRLHGTMQASAGTSRLYAKVQRLHLGGLLRVSFALLRPLLRRHLLGAHPNLWAFHFYKLGYYASLRPLHV